MKTTSRSSFVPRIVQIRVPGEFIGAIIGKGGEVIQKIQRETGTTVTITEDNVNGVSEGIVDIFGDNKEAMDNALEWFNSICAVPEVGKVYHGTVVSTLEFGAFVEILPGKEGLLHISEIDWGKTDKVEDVLNVGDEVDVKLLEIDAKTGKMRLSRKALIEKPEGYVEPERRPRNSSSDRGPRRDDRRGPRRDDRRGSDERRNDRRDDRRAPRRDSRPHSEPRQDESSDAGFDAPDYNSPDIF